MNAAIIGGGALIITLLVWVILHHARPEMKVEVGAKAWINLARPPQSPGKPQQDDEGREDPDDDRQEDSGSDPTVGV